MPQTRRAEQRLPMNEKKTFSRHSGANHGLLQCRHCRDKVVARDRTTVEKRTKKEFCMIKQAEDKTTLIPFSSRTLWSITGIALLLLLIAANLFCGSIHLPAEEVWHTLTGRDTTSATAFIVLQSRLPILLTAALSGAALAVAGLLLQTIFANPLADPSILGVNSGAGLGVAIAMLLLGGTFTAGELTVSGFLLTMSAAAVGAAIVILLLLIFSRRMPGTLTLLIAGVMISFVTSSLISLLSFYATAQGVQSYMIWGLGNFSGVTLNRLPFFAGIVLTTLAGTLLLSKPLNALLLGDNYAQNAGVNVQHSRTWVLLLTGLLTAVVTALCGPISFIGLAVPHAARLTLRSSDHRCLLPATMLWGANVALFCNLVSVLPGDRGTLPLNTLTPLLGVPMVFYLLMRRK